MENLKYLGSLFTIAENNDVLGDGEDQKVSMSAEWIFPEIGFNLYSEIGIDDFTWDKIANPFHTMIYTIGIKQLIPIPFFKNIHIEAIAEYNNFEMSQDFQLQWNYLGFYSHGKIIQGYTNKGQIIGAGTGAFGNSQYFGLQIFYPKGSSLLYIHRYCPDNNYIYNLAVNDTANNLLNYWDRYKTYLNIGATTQFYLLKNTTISFGAVYSYIRYNFYSDNTDTNNFHFIMGMKYIF